MDRVFVIGSKKGSMECVMNFPCLGEVELICDRREDFDDGEGSFSFRSEFWISNGMLKVSCFQPDFVSFGEGGESSVVMQRHNLAGEFVSGEGFILCNNKGL